MVQDPMNVVRQSKPASRGDGAAKLQKTTLLMIQKQRAKRNGEPLTKSTPAMHRWRKAMNRIGTARSTESSLGDLDHADQEAEVAHMIGSWGQTTPNARAAHG